MALFAAAIVLLATFAVYGEHGLLHLRRLQIEQRLLDHTTFDLQQHNERLRVHLQRIESDDLYLERIARERLGLVRPGERVYRTQPSRAAAH